MTYETTQYLVHHGIKGQKWYERRFQNPDGTLTEAGIARYRKSVARVEKLDAGYKKINDRIQKSAEKSYERTLQRDPQKHPVAAIVSLVNEQQRERAQQMWTDYYYTKAKSAMHDATMLMLLMSDKQISELNPPQWTADYATILVKDWEDDK